MTDHILVAGGDFRLPLYSIQVSRLRWMKDDPSLAYKPRAWYERGTEKCVVNLFFFEFVSRMRVIVFDQLADLDSASSFESCDLSHA